MSMELTDEQQVFMGKGPFLVNACPGSGKTTAIVERFVRRSRESHKGIALLSFTNRAIDEVRFRTRGYPELTRAPNFVGNFDAFIRHFIVTPEFVRSRGFIPSYLRSWHDAPVDRMVSIGRDRSIGLEHFAWNNQGRLELIQSSLRHSDSVYIASLTGYSDPIRVLEEEATTLANEHIKIGVMDASAARAIGMRALRGERGGRLLVDFAARFEEVIVDEGQDCDASEFLILKMLREGGVKVSLVSDSDQRIFGFRRLDNNLYDKFVEEWPRDCRLEFSKSFRSSPQICAAVSSLCGSGRSTVSNLPNGAPILIVSGTREEQRTQFVEQLERRGLPVSEAMVLAHWGKEARRLAGVEYIEQTSTQSMARALRAAVVLKRVGSSAQSRLEAIREVEMIVLDAVEWPSAWVLRRREDKLGYLGIEPTWLRMVAWGSVRIIVESVERQSCATEVQKWIRTKLEVREIRVRDLTEIMETVSEPMWNEWKHNRDSPTSVLRYQTIHGAKGGEWSSVLLSIENETRAPGFDEWNRQLSGEDRRLLYVGASRARNLLALAVSSRRAPSLERLLQRDGISYEFVR